MHLKLRILMLIAIISSAVREIQGGSEKKEKKDSKKGGDGEDGKSKGVKLIVAVNAGGPEHTDVYGITYIEDPLEDGIASDHGMQLNMFGRVEHQDEILYRTERYGTTSFSYDLPIPEDGDYVLVLKFCEVYFRSPGQKVFDVALNGKHMIVDELDIYGTVGFGTAHQEIIGFKVSEGVTKLVVDGKSSKIENKRISLAFIKGRHDNPKINAFYLLQGKPEDIPPLPEVRFDEEEDDELYNDFNEDPQAFERRGKNYKKSGPSSFDPWEEQSTWAHAGPILISLGVGAAFIFACWKCLRNL